MMILASALLIGCDQENASDEDVTVSGDPAQAARAFMTAFLNGSVEICGTYATAESRASVELLCQQRADVQAQASLSATRFNELRRDGRFAFVEMAGTYRQTFVNPETGETVENEVSEPVVLVMYYQDEFWRFDDFASEE